jgi:hypothetical protein
VGGGFERVFDEHGHNTLSAVVGLRLGEAWHVALAPGLTFSDEPPRSFEPSLHFEAAYEILLDGFHVGPALEVAVDPEDIHISLGAHLGFGF